MSIEMQRKADKMKKALARRKKDKERIYSSYKVDTVARERRRNHLKF